MFKLAVFDIDGTLVRKGYDISEKTIETIRGLEDQGISCIIATGRGKSAINEVLKKTKLSNYVALNGQYVVFEGEEMYSYIYPETVKERVTDICNKNDFFYGFVSKNGYYIPRLNELLKVHDSAILTSDLLIDFVEDEVNQVIVFCDQSRYSYFSEFLETYELTSWHTGGFDMLYNKRSKAVGIDEIAKKLSIKPEEIICFGDGENDIDMLRYAGLGIAMGDASESVKDAADYITGSVEEEGIYTACQKQIFNRT